MQPCCIILTEMSPTLRRQRSAAAATAGTLPKQPSRVLAVDVNPARVALLKRSAEAQGFAGVVTALAADSVRLPDELPRLQGVFDRVLVDAPCTGLGVLAKRADLRWRRTERDLQGLVALQDALLFAGARLVKPGGVLVYSTCSTEPEENELRVLRFLEAAAEGAAAAAAAASSALPADGATAPVEGGEEGAAAVVGEWVLEEAAGLLPASLAAEGAVSACGRFLQPLPHRTGTDGAFAARLRRVK